MMSFNDLKSMPSQSKYRLLRFYEIKLKGCLKYLRALKSANSLFLPRLKPVGFQAERFL
jgi:hypothetical protein